MDLPQLEDCLEVHTASISNFPQTSCVNLETEIPEVLYLGMKDFISTNPKWDQYTVMTSALANFLFQNGCEDRAVIERYLNDLFRRADT